MSEEEVPEYDRRFRGSKVYRDDAGPVLRESIVAFLDILGSRQQIKTLDNTGLRRLTAVLEYFGPVLTSFDLSGPDVAILGFTDNIVLATPVNEAYDTGVGMTKVEILLRNAGAFQFFLLQEGIPLRGAVVRGPVFLAEHFGTGQAIVDAYELESEKAVYPRIILSDDVVRDCRAAYFKYTDLEKELTPGICRLVTIDREDGVAFISYLFAPAWGDRDWRHAERHKSFIIQELGKDHNARVRAKYAWMARYHNFIFAHVPEYQIPEIDQGAGFEWLDLE